MGRSTASDRCRYLGLPIPFLWFFEGRYSAHGRLLKPAYGGVLNRPPTNSTTEDVPPGRIASFLTSPQTGPVFHGRPFGPNRGVVRSDRPVPYPPFGTGRSSSLIPRVRGVLFAVSSPRNGQRLDLHTEELVKGRQQLLGAQPTLLDVDDGPRLVVEDGHR